MGNFGWNILPFSPLLCLLCLVLFIRFIQVHPFCVLVHYDLRNFPKV